jgi:NDP-sugar pyrophosphorylase family protein
MAGGRGTRLHGLTNRTPKPMLRIGAKPLIETIIDGFAAQGFTKFVLCVNYLAELIEAHFGDGSDKGLDITYIREEQPLGTAGALRHLPDQPEPFIVSNADILIQPVVQYRDLLAKHAEHGRDATMCLALHQYQVPYGVAELDGDVVSAVREKPVTNFYVNAGLYVLPARAPSMLPHGPSNMPELLNRLTVGKYEIEGTWVDIGSFDAFAAAHVNWALKVRVA